MTLLVTSIAVDNLDELKTYADQAWAAGADAIEVRIDSYEGDPGQLAAYLEARPDRTWIVTCRSAEEGGHYRGDTRERVATLIAAASGTDAYVDFEWTDWQRSANIRQKIKLAARRPHGAGHRLILSHHDVAGVPQSLSAMIREMKRVPEASVAKVAYHAAHVGDTFAALDLMHESGHDSIATAMGEDGLWTRVLAGKLGAFATYCSLEPGAATAPGQLTLDAMTGRYRWSAINAGTRVFGVIGDPIVHSMSPLLFNRWFPDADINAVYLPLRVPATPEGLRRYLNGCRERPWLDIGGLSVTIPHKAEALHWVGNGADWMARRLGALNTLSFQGATVTGHNTDCYAAVSSVAGALGRARTDLDGLTVDVLGTGGAACAVVYGFPMFGCKVTVYGRSEEKARRLADRFSVRAAAWEDRVHRQGDVLVNCTGVGMWPNVDDSPMPRDALDGRGLVFDVVYNPLQTRLLREAAAVGCKTLSGLDMFVRQAAMQFELWTGQSPDTKVARDLIIDEIPKHSRSQA